MTPEVLVTQYIDAILIAGLTKEQVDQALRKVTGTMTHAGWAIHPDEVQDLLDSYSSREPPGPVIQQIYS